MSMISTPTEARAELSLAKEKRVAEFFNGLSSSTMGLVDEFYDSQAIFEDPVVHLEGVEQVRRYYANLYKSVETIRFDFSDQVTQIDSHVAVWKMSVKTKAGKDVVVHGTSYFKFSPSTGKALYHRDYFDMGEFVYEKVPVLQWVIKRIKKMMLPDSGAAEVSKKDMSKKDDPKSDKEALKKKLTPEQYRVTQEEGTEAPFNNAYWNHKEAGIYVDVVTGEALFSSTDKFDSGTGWPSFSKPIEESMVQKKKDKKLFMERTEVRSKDGDSHLGHVFDDGPGPGGQRYCINSAALRFVPVKDLEKEGYAKYKKLFEEGGKREPQSTKATLQTATLAGGCFWGVEELLRKEPGVVKVEVGYTGGTSDNPTYEQVKTGSTGHAESVEVQFDPAKTSYEEILKFFFRLHDPTTVNQQGNDRGSQYRSAVFYHSEDQRKAAEKIKAMVDASGNWKNKVVTEIVPAKKFYSAEEYHQDYLQKHPHGYTCHFVRKFKF